MKYVMLENVEGHKFPIIFPDSMVHADVAETIVDMVFSQGGDILEATSAGFIALDVTTSGKSESLNMTSDKDDDMYIKFNDSIGTVPLDLMMPTLRELLRSKVK